MAGTKTKRKNKAALETLKKLAYEWVMNSDKTQKEIADIVGVSEVTMSKWATDGRWEELKAYEAASRGGACRNILKKIFEESQKEDCDADKIAKYSSALERLENKSITVPNIINIFIEFGNWLYPKDPEASKKLTNYMNLYVEEKVSG